MYSWYIDGEVHSSGLGMTSFRAWPEAGTHEISFVARDPEGSVVSKWSDATLVSAEESIKTTVRKGDKVLFSAPGGYDHVSWLVDGKIVADNQPDRLDTDTQEIVFRKRGVHILTCKVQGSENGNFRLITWLVDVI